MGYLLSSAIKMQGGVSGPTLTVTINNFTGDGELKAYKNGSLYTTITTGSANVPIVAGDTFYITINGSGGQNSWLYTINGVNSGSGSGPTLVTSTTYTASGSNIYVLIGTADVV
jgi:hypothetical protein